MPTSTESLSFRIPQEERTKLSKKIVTYFFPVGADLKQVVVEWVQELRDDLR
jgi:hypothetical protein